jgi:hypothetical protein
MKLAILILLVGILMVTCDGSKVIAAATIQDILFLIIPIGIRMW